MTTAISESPRPETQRLYESLQAEYGHIEWPYEDGTGRADGYCIILHKDEDLVTLHPGDYGGMPLGGGRAIWIDTKGERAEIDSEEDALWDGTRAQCLMFERIRKQRALDAEVQAHSGCGVWDVMAGAS